MLSTASFLQHYFFFILQLKKFYFYLILTKQLEEKVLYSLTFPFRHFASSLIELKRSTTSEFIITFSIFCQAWVFKVGRWKSIWWAYGREGRIPHFHGAHFLPAPHSHGRGQGEVPKHGTSSPSYSTAGCWQKTIRWDQVRGDGTGLPHCPWCSSQSSRAPLHPQRLFSDAHLQKVQEDGQRDSASGVWREEDPRALLPVLRVRWGCREGERAVRGQAALPGAL